jgi:RNA polymerase sigma-70 factor, ECF subfamily
MAMENESVLLEAARRMDQAALGQIFDHYASPLFNYAWRLCGDPLRADHIVGDVFVKLLDQLAAGKGPTSNLRAYLFEVAYHRVIDESRSARRAVPIDVADWLAPRSESPILRLEDQLLFEQMMGVIHAELSDDQRHVLILRFLEDFSIRETAAIMGKTEINVKVIQNRAIAALRKALDRREMQHTLPAFRNREVAQSLSI